MNQLSPDEDAASVTVLLVDDHAIWRSGVRSMLLPTEFEVVGEAPGQMMVAMTAGVLLGGRLGYVL